MTEAKDWLVLTLDSQYEPIRIQKTLFKMAKEAKLPRREQYEFRPHNWGPFSSQIYKDIDELVHRGFVERVPQPGISWAGYRLTPHGKQRALKLRKKASERSLQQLDRVSIWVSARPFTKLLKDVYKDYPDMAKNSLFR